jgi:hypothetical protein
MIGSRGFRMVEPPRASSASAHIPWSLVTENRAPFVTENWRRPPKVQQRSRSPPGLPGAERQHLPQIRRWASGCHRQPRQTNLHPNRVPNGVSCGFSHYLGSRSMQEPCQPS